MEYGDLYLRFDDEAQALEILEGYEGSVDMIGIIYKPTGNMITNGEGSYPELSPIPGWHCNIRGSMPASLEPFTVVVNTPSRVWA
jgi:hypothetical protein